VINEWARAALKGGVEPTAAWLVRRGVHPDAVTVTGTALSTGAALWLIPTDHLVAGALVVGVLAMLDVLDGAMARARGVKSPFGGVLDSVCDRLVDGAVFAGITWWAAERELWLLVGLALTCLVTGQLISYIKARAGEAGLRADGGLVERAERLILGLLGVGLVGLGVPYALDIALGLLAVGSVITVGQRVVAVWHSAREQYGAATGHTPRRAPADQHADQHADQPSDGPGASA
jgi:CDP-diacylglycerol---glycerol-3-phosphate 3-phosphatidyltransferase